MKPESANRAALEIKALGPEHLDEILTLLVSAFQDRPFYRYIAPDNRERREFLALNFRLRMEQGLGITETDLAFLDGRIAGIALWVPPAAAPQPEDHALEDALSVFSPGLRKRFFGFLRTLTAARDQVIGQPYWSLAPIAILPEKQGSGIASTLIRKKLKEIDALSRPCFLGTQDKTNLAIYARYGFLQVREDPLSSDIIHYTMIRPALPPGSLRTAFG